MLESGYLLKSFRQAMPAQVGKYEWCYASGEDDSEEIKAGPVADLLCVQGLVRHVCQVFVPIEDSTKAKDCDVACR